MRAEICLPLKQLMFNLEDAGCHGKDTAVWMTDIALVKDVNDFPQYLVESAE